MKHIQFLVGFMLGGLVFGGGAVFASNYVDATPTDNIIKLNGEIIQPEAYLINGHNYFKMKDIAKLIDFGLSWDERNATVLIDTTVNYTEPESSTGSDGYVQIPQDGSRFVPQEGDSILCDDGSTYEIKDMSRYDKNAFASGALPELPTPTCDWSQFPDLTVPKIEVKRFIDLNRDTLFIMNYSEMRRMQYTLYNAIGSNPDTWANGKLKLRSNGSPVASVQFGIPTGTETGVQSFWPWAPDRLVMVFESCPSGTYSLEAWDVYKKGVFQYTEYKFQAI